MKILGAILLSTMVFSLTGVALGAGKVRIYPGRTARVSADVSGNRTKSEWINCQLIRSSREFFASCQAQDYRGNSFACETRDTKMIRVLSTINSTSRIQISAPREAYLNKGARRKGGPPRCSLASVTNGSHR